MPSPRPSRVALAVEILAAMAEMGVIISPPELADRLGWPVARQAPILFAMETAGLVESWPDPERLGSFRMMLSERAAREIGLTLDGDRWRPDRKSPGTIRLRKLRGPRRTG